MEPNELTQNYVLKAYADIKKRTKEEAAESGGNGTSPEAIHFSNPSLASKFPFVLAQLRQMRPNCLILDIVLGCGDNLYTREDALTIGMDVNKPNGKAKHLDFVLADANCPPFRKGLFDVVLLVSVLHHIPSEQKRVKCLRNCLWLASAQKSRIITVQRPQLLCCEVEHGKQTVQKVQVLVPYNLEDMHKFGHIVPIPFNRETTREQRIMMNSVPIRVKVPLNVPIPNYLPKSVRQRVLEVMDRVGWLNPMMSMQFYEQQLQFMTNFIIDRLSELKRIKDLSLKNVPARADPNLPISELAVKVLISALDDAFVHLRMVYRDVLKYRYYHLFSADEFDHLLTKIRTADPNFADFQSMSSEYEMGNWCAIIGKSLKFKKIEGNE